jgi:hypothetical protein
VLLEMGKIVADLAEDLAIEILSSFTAEDYPSLGKTLTRLEAAASKLAELGIDVPFPVAEVLRNANASASRN